MLGSDSGKLAGMLVCNETLKLVMMKWRETKRGHEGIFIHNATISIDIARTEQGGKASHGHIG
jgi:hypothetical protein